MSVSALIYQLGNLYAFLIIIYVVLTWIPAGGIVDDVRRVVGTLVEPYLSLFRRIIPPIGMVDITPIIALLVLQMLIVPLLTRLTAGL